MEPITSHPQYKTKPFRHQAACLAKFGHFEAFALLADMGTGKSWIMINNMAALWGNGDVDSVFILAPNGVHTNWGIKEFPVHMPDWVDYYDAAWTASKRKADVAAIEKLYELPNKRTLRIFAMNYEAMGTPRGFAAAKRFADTSGNLMVIADEADALKNPKAVRTKNFMKLRKEAKWRRIMTGTLINNAPFDAFVPFTFLDPKILGTTSFYAFKAEYAKLLDAWHPLVQDIVKKSGGRGAPQLVARDKDGLPVYRNLDKLSALMSPYSFRVLKDDCLDLPPKIYETLYFDMSKEQREVYASVKRDCRIMLAEEPTAVNKLTALGKLSQITSGFYHHDEADTGVVRIENGGAKLALLMQKIDEIKASVIIWARYREEMTQIAHELTARGVKFIEYHGGVSKEERISNIDKFQSGAARVFIGNTQSGGTGITLVEASYVIYYSNTFSLRNRLQSEDRAHRIGQTKTVTIIDIAATGTVDEHVISTLLSKKDVATTITDKNLDIFK